MTLNMMTIDEHEAEVQKIYKHVSTWDDLIDTNVAFLEGRNKCSLYYFNSFYDEYYHDGMFKIEDNLLHLHREFGIFTHNGQNGSVNQYNICQRSYLNFVCPRNEGMVERLLADTRLYTFVRQEYADGSCSIQHNCPQEISLTEPHGAMFGLDIYENYDNELLLLAEEFPKVHELLCDADHIFIAAREFPKKGKKPVETTTCLLEILEGRQ